jgi:S1/P1 Nuclease
MAKVKPARLMPPVATTLAPVVDDVQELIKDIFSKLQSTGTLSQSSVDLDISVGDSNGRSCRVALKMTGGAIGVSAVAPLPVIADLGAIPEFNAEGHHVIALIMEKDLAANSPETLTKVNKILKSVDRTLLEAATFPDDIRNKQPKTKPFHFIDIPFEEGGPVNPDLPAAPHVLSKMEEYSKSLQSKKGTAQRRADDLSWLIHLFGDVHQPLHCIDHISELHPEGDRGGNLFIIKSAKKNLHSLWDSSVNVTQSLDEDEIADEIIQTHPRSSLQQELGVTDPEEWARTSFQLAKTNAYTIEEDPDNPPQPSMAYKKNMEKIGRKQAALAGYRLAERLQAIL